MVTRVKIEGTDELRDLIAKLREAGDKKVLNALRRGIRKAGKEATDDVARVVRGLNIEGHPLLADAAKRRTTGKGSRGGSGAMVRLSYDVRRSKGDLGRAITRAMGRAGLRDTIARALTMQISGGKTSASVRIKVNSKALPEDQRSLPRHMEKGTWRHPVFGDRDTWVNQTSTPDWFKGTLRKHAPAVRSAINAEVSAEMRKVAT